MGGEGVERQGGGLMEELRGKAVELWARWFDGGVGVEGWPWFAFREREMDGAVTFVKIQIISTGETYLHTYILIHFDIFL